MARPRPLLGLLAGTAAGLIATGAMQVVRAARARKAEGADEAATTDPVLPYVVGAAVGGVYGLLAEYVEDAPAGFGTAYGLAATTLLEQDSASAGDKPVPATASPLVYGAVLIGARALLAAGAKAAAARRDRGRPGRRRGGAPTRSSR